MSKIWPRHAYDAGTAILFVPLFVPRSSHRRAKRSQPRSGVGGLAKPNALLEHLEYIAEIGVGGFTHFGKLPSAELSGASTQRQPLTPRWPRSSRLPAISNRVPCARIKSELDTGHVAETASQIA